MKPWGPWLGLLGLLGCGRLGFEDPADDPPLPGTLVCSATLIAIPPVGSAADLAITPSGAAFLAVWADLGGPLLGASIDLEPTEPVEVLPGPIDAIAGIATTPVTTLLVTATGSTQSLYTLATIDAPPALVTAEPRAIARPPILVDFTDPAVRVWMRSDATGLVATYVADDGQLGGERVIPQTDPVIAVNAADNFGHGHLVWNNDPGSGGTYCIQADLDLAGPAPMLGGFEVNATDCRAPRITSGPAGSDAIFTAFTTGANAVTTRLLGGGGVDDVTRSLSPNGRAPKTEFDGVAFWVAWIDQPATGDVLRLARVQGDGTNAGVDLVGWVPRGDEAFELVRHGTKVYLALLRTDTLALLETCAP